MSVKICLSIAGMDAAFEKLVKKLEKIAHIDVVGLEDISLAGYDIFIGKKLTAKELETADCLKVIFAYKTGVDDFPMDVLKEKGIQLVNSHADSHYIAEYAFGLSLSMVNRITEFDKKMRKGIWYDMEDPYWRSFFEMKVGLLGYGHIGQEIHKILKRNHVEAYTIDRGKQYEDIHLVPDLETLCDETDILIISLPKTPETTHIINRDIVARLKDKYIVNVGRINCLEQTAIFEGLKDGYMAGVANDTWRNKPKSPMELWDEISDYDILQMDNIVFSPHQAMRVKDGHERYVLDIAEKVRDYIERGELIDVVDLTKGY